MHIIKFSDNTKDVWVKSCSFPLTIVTEDNNTYKIILSETPKGTKVSAIK